MVAASYLPDQRLNLRTKRYSTTSKNLDTNNDMKQVDPGKRVLINISGVVFETQERTLNRYPETILGTAEKRNYLLGCTNEIFFERNRNSFESILYFYQSEGKLIRPHCVPIEHFEDECHFFGLPRTAINRMKEIEYGLPFEKSRSKVVAPSNCHQVWLFVNFPQMWDPYPTLAVAYAIFNYGLVVVAVLIFCFELQLESVLEGNQPPCETFKVVDKIEIGMNIFFGIDFLLRLIVSAAPLSFLSNAMNIVEFASIFPFFIIYACINSRSRTSIIRILRTLRVCRLFRLGRISASIRAAGRVAKASFSDILCTINVAILACVIFAVILFAIETPYNEEFSSIPNSMYWAWQTMFCLGYGDIVPTTMLGKIAAS